jgi:hypothetical protein
MKKLKIYAVLLIVVFLLFGCEKPAPTELVQNDQSVDDPASVEVITKNLSNDSTGNGYDSTGVTDDVNQYNNVIIVSGVKITSRLVSVRLSIAQAMFFDKSKPFYGTDGRLISYRTRFVGNIFFDGNKARLIPHVILSSILASDTSQGLQYVLYSRNLRGDAFIYNYNSQVKFKLVSLHDSLNYDFNIPTPPEVTGTVDINGTRASGNLRAVLQWDADPGTKMIINIGASAKGNANVIPIYQIKTKDDGKYIIPASLLNSIPVKSFDKLYISFVRQLKINRKNEDLVVFSQSVHTIIIEDR